METCVETVVDRTKYLDRKVWWRTKKQRRSQRWQHRATSVGGRSRSESIGDTISRSTVRRDGDVPVAFTSGRFMTGARRERMQWS